MQAFAGLDRQALIDKIREADDERLFVVAEGFRRGMSLAEINAVTNIDAFFLAKIQKIVNLELELVRAAGQGRFPSRQ